MANESSSNGGSVGGMRERLARLETRMNAAEAFKVEHKREHSEINRKLDQQIRKMDSVVLKVGMMIWPLRIGAGAIIVGVASFLVVWITGKGIP